MSCGCLEMKVYRENWDQDCGVAKSITIRKGGCNFCSFWGGRVTAFYTVLWGVGVVSLCNNLWSLQPQDFFWGHVWFVYAL